MVSIVSLNIYRKIFSSCCLPKLNLISQQIRNTRPKKQNKNFKTPRLLHKLKTMLQSIIFLSLTLLARAKNPFSFMVQPLALSAKPLEGANEPEPQWIPYSTDVECPKGGGDAFVIGDCSWACPCTWSGKYGCNLRACLTTIYEKCKANSSCDRPLFNAGPVEGI